jgi:predicted AlkP superfamily phosphohydrolase/phosphomutase
VPAIACGVPATFPPVESPNTTVVTGMLTPNGVPRTAPLAVEDDLHEHGLVIDWEELRDLEGSVALPSDEARLALHVMDRYPWRLMVTVFRASDGIFHTHPSASDGHRRMFGLIDVALGEMRTRLRPDDTLMLVSDHGMTRLREVVNLNALFVREGLLTPRARDRSKEERATRTLERIKRWPVMRSRLLRNRWTRRASEALRQRAAAQVLDFGREGRRQPRLSESLVDWRATTCFFVDLGYGSGVWLNLEGREPFGIVPATDYEATRGRVAELLESRDGLVVKRREDVYSGPFVERAPDLLVSTSREDLGLSGRLLDTPVRTAVDVPYYHHTRRGIWVVVGPGARCGRIEERISIVDVAPTVLHALGLEVPADVDGRVRLELFEPDSEVVRRPVRFGEPPMVAVPDEVAEYDDEAIRAKLRGLGYMH